MARVSHSSLRFATLLFAASTILGCTRRSADRVDTAAGSLEGAACDALQQNAAAALCAARAFLATLNDDQKASVVVAPTAEKAARWSNLPCSLSCRNGLLLSSLDSTQRTAAVALAKIALSGAGFETLQAIRKADSILAAQPSGRGGPPGGGFRGPPPNGAPPGGPPGQRGGDPPGMPGGLQYGENNYVVAFLGAPSDTGRWILQLGGHHLAINITYRGSTAVESATPYFLGVEPQAFTIGGVTYVPLQPRKVAMYAMLNSLDASQKQKAQLSARFDDVVVGPGHDGRFPTSEGLAIGSLSAAQRKLVTTAIEAWVKDVPEGAAQAILRDYVSETALQGTRVAWSGSTDSTVVGSYIRIDGPRVWIEFVCQGGVVFRDQIHFHTIWRDKAKDYGASFSF